MTNPPHLHGDRIVLIDRLRGLAMVLMLLDHARTFLVNTGYHPLDPVNTNFILYFTRWITHLAAVSFVLLAGVSVRLRLGKTGSREGMVLYLLQRGGWLIFLEFTLIAFLWRFRLGPVFTFQVIGVLGVSMLILAGLLYLPRRLVFFLAVLILLGHNLLDRVPLSELPTEQGLFKFLHVYGEIAFCGTVSLRVSYPLLPWLGLMLLGFSAGGLLTSKRELSPRMLFLSGAFLLSAFVLLRLAGGYGNLYAWQEMDTLSATLFSFLNCAKYPPSLSFLLMMLGTGSIVAGVLQKTGEGRVPDMLTVFGRVPLFFYLVHLLLLHLLAMGIFAILTGDSVINIFEDPDQIGLPLWTAWVVFFLSLAVLYPVCRKWDSYRRGKKWRHLL